MRLILTTMIALAICVTPARGDPPIALVSKNIDALESNKKPAQLQAMASLATLGKGGRLAAPALKALVDREKDPKVALQAVQTLTLIGAHKELRALILHPTVPVRRHAVWGLAVIGPSAKHSAPDVIRLMNSDDPILRGLAAQALGEIGTGSEETATALIKLLADNQPDVRMYALLALMNLGPSSVPALEKVVTSEEPLWVRTASLQALANQGIDAKSTTPTLSKLLKDPDATIRAQSATTLSAIGTGAEEALPALLESLLDRDVQVQTSAFAATIAVGQGNRRVLHDGLKSANARGRWQTPFVFGQGLTGKQAVPVLIKQLSEKDVGTRVGAALALGRIGVDAEPAVPALLRMSKEENPQIKQVAQQVLAQLDQKNREAYAKRLFKEQEQWLREAKAQQVKMIAAQEKLTRDLRHQLLTDIRGLGVKQLDAIDALKDLARARGIPVEAIKGLPRMELEAKILNDPFPRHEIKLAIAMQNKPQQAHMYNLVRMHLVYASQKDDSLAGDWVRDQIDLTGTEAVPALTHGVNLAAKYQPGFV